MSHAPERTEKDCLNCGTIIHGRFCHVCGQENIVPKESFWGLVVHFFYDITHFDSKFFDSLKYLFFRPGYLSKEFVKGRRASYLNPVRMYVFTSALFFLIFFAIGGGDSSFKVTGDEPFSRAQRDSLIEGLRGDLARDTGNANTRELIGILQDTSREVRPSELFPFTGAAPVISTFGRDYRSMREYDSLQSLLPPGKRDGWLRKLWNKRAIKLNEKYQHDPRRVFREAGDELLHRLPYLLFVSLPFFALLLKLLYLRRKQFYYADHGIFSIHHYILSFLLLLLVFGWNALAEWTGWGVFRYLLAITAIAWPLYLLFAMKRFYGQGWGKTILKFLLLNIAGLTLLGLLFASFILFSIFQL